jgi:uncharacterized membrane protein YphA (DoxX/SURF4 family)
MCGCPKLESLTLLAIRLLLFFPLFEAGLNKLNNFDAKVDWFGNADYGLGLPFPALMVGLVIAAELGGSVLLLLGLFTRLAALPLIVVMLVAAFLFHAPHGWLMISNGASMWFGPMEGALRLGELQQAIEAAGAANPALMSVYDATLAHGDLAVVNNGMETAITYLLFLLVLVSRGAGLLSVDAIVRRCCRAASCETSCCDMPAGKTMPMPKVTVVKPAAKPVAKKAAPAKKKAAKRRR